MAGDGGSQTRAPATATAAAWWEDLIDIYLSPAEVFERRREGRWLTPAAALAALSVLLYFVLLPAGRAVMDAAMAENPDAAEAMARWQGLFVVLGALFIPIALAAAIALRAALMWLFARLSDLALAFDRAVLIGVYAAFVILPEQVVESVLILLQRDGLDPERDASTGLLRFVPPDAVPAWVEPLIGRLDIFPIWQAALWALGLHIVARATWTTAILIAAAVWILSALPGVVTAAFTGG